MKRRPRLNRNEVCYLQPMKKLVCLFLMLWLPISAGSAWAMSTQMQVSAAFDTADTAAMEMPCHDMAIENTDSAPEQVPGMKHNCSACGACFSVLAAGIPLLPHFSSAALTSRMALPADDQTVSQTYPPALRPPITS
jgi:hypothetical protein